MKTVFITGATSGIGHALAIHLTKEGHRVIATGWREEKREELKRDCPEIFGVVSLNVAVKEDFAKLPEQLSALGVETIDTLYVNAGIQLELTRDHGDVPYEDWPHDKIRCKTMEVNYFGAMRTVEALLPYVRRSADGRIFFATGKLGSFYWHNHPNEEYRASLTKLHPAYSASKMALNGEMVHLAEHKPEIMVAALDPGWVETSVGGSGHGKWKPNIPLARATERLAKFLVGDVDKNLHGKIIDVARGRAADPW